MNNTNNALETDPLWYKDAIIYELHVKSFFDSNGDGIGDFPGVIEKLDYLKNLGITAIWLLPFYPSPLCDDGYDIADYLNVHPAYGTIKDFKRFVKEAHDRNIRVITELVINHTSDQHPWFQASRRAPAGSMKRNYYVWSDTDQKYKNTRIIFTDTEVSNWTWDPVAKAYYWHRFFHHQPDLNYDNPHVLKAVLRLLRFWFDMGVDGMRLDAVPYLIEREGTNCENLSETHQVLKAIRKKVDDHYSSRMLLAEANQWPEDVRPYFGNEDECHMAFHFPLMPRMYMALRQEDRHPITEILRQTPAIPESCQWALFLRNHDELTLEMVTDEERDYMYKEYAVDPKMRLNIGIRRRLAPLMDHNRRVIELLYSLLFSFPGTPVIYYGDEIGMGDNIYLGDRNGVRTPMQWNGDRNAGFSTADAAQLYSPVVVDPINGYQVVNVHAQERDTSSFLQWIKHMIALRKQHKTFGRGTIQFLYPQNRKILAYIRRYEEEIILCVANLSRFVQPAELDLSEFRGMNPVEMLGQVEFPPIGELPYFITFSPHAFYWFQLTPKKATTPVSYNPAHLAEQLPAIITFGSPEAFFASKDTKTLENSILPAYLCEKRWFGAKTKTIKSVSIVDNALLMSIPVLAYLLLIEVQFSDFSKELYFLPLGIAPPSEATRLIQAIPNGLVARLVTKTTTYLLYDALADDLICNQILESMAQQQEKSGSFGVFRAFLSAANGHLIEKRNQIEQISRGTAEQSNSMVNFQPHFIFKVYRHLDKGINPDFEMVEFLSEEAKFPHVPKIIGGIEYRRKGEDPFTLAVMQEYVYNQGSGWDYTLQEHRRFLELAAMQDNPTDPFPSVLQELMGHYLQSIETLGRRTAEMHLALTKSASKNFIAEPLSEVDFSQMAKSGRMLIQRTLSILSKNIDKLPEISVDPAYMLLGKRSYMLARMDSLFKTELKAMKIRCHGDYHLGQVLWSENDFIIIDFEGEPARALSERRAKQSPLKDVAGMLRSFDYVAYSGLLIFTREQPNHVGTLQKWSDLWKTGVSEAFLKAYRDKLLGTELIPAETESFKSLLEYYILDKALYELFYELNHRPDWAQIPLKALLGAG